MKLSNVIDLIEKRIPLNWSEEWDNSGLQVGDPDCEIRKIGISLNVTEKTVEAASKSGCDLLISHHPVIFRPIKNLIPDRPASKAMLAAIRNKLSLYAAHTNWDSSPEGVNFILAELLDLKNIFPLIPSEAGSSSLGLGAVGDFAMPMPFEGVLELIKEKWSLSGLKAYGSRSVLLTRIALGGGSCGDMWPNALQSGATLFVTADISYHERQDALNSGLCLADVDHGEMERASLPKLRSIVEEETGLITELIHEDESEFFIK